MNIFATIKDRNYTLFGILSGVSLSSLPVVGQYFWNWLHISKSIGEKVVFSQSIGDKRISLFISYHVPAGWEMPGSLLNNMVIFSILPSLRMLPAERPKDREFRNDKDRWDFGCRYLHLYRYRYRRSKNRHT